MLDEADGQLTFADMKKLLARFTYKPNWKFGLSLHNNEVKIQGFGYVENSREPFQPWDLEQQKSMYIEPDFYFVRHDSLVYNSRLGYHSPRRALVPLQATYLVPPMDTEEMFWAWLRDFVLRDMELHERDEWIKVDGKPIFDPHKNDAF